MKRFFSRYHRLMSVHNRTLLLLEILYMLIFITLIIPLLSVSINYVMGLWGQSYITQNNISSFLTFPPAIILLIIFILIFTIFIFIKTTSHLQYCCFEAVDKRPNYLRILALGFIKAVRALFTTNIALPFYTLLIYVFTNVPILIGITLHLNMPVKLPNGASDTVFLRGLIILIILLICFIAFRGIFTLHFCISDREGFINGLEDSKKLLKGHTIKTVAIFLFYNLFLAVLFYLSYNTILFIMALLVYFFAEKSMATTIFLSFYPRVNIYTSLFFIAVCSITNFNIISTLYQRYRYDTDPWEDLAIRNDEPDPDPFRSKKHKKFILLILLIILAGGLINFYLTVKNDSFNLNEALMGIQIASHRGNSIDAPENTLLSLESAIESHADYAEIDIQQTKDGELILLHDKNLWRTTGLNKAAWELTYEEISQLDAGSWFSNEYAGTRIPTLKEALELCKGRIKLNIEIKISGHEQDLEEKLISLIEEYDFENQCIVSSWNSRPLQKVKALNEKIKTGYIISAAYGNYYKKDYIDFISMRSGFISRNVVENVHRAGKEIHAWTVNSVTELERMKSLGVDSIITDNPYRAKEVLFRDETNDNIIEMLNRMLVNRSVYQLVKKRR